MCVFAVAFAKSHQVCCQCSIPCVYAHFDLKQFVKELRRIVLLLDEFDVPLDVVAHVLFEVCKVLSVLVNQVSIGALNLVPLLLDAFLVVHDALVLLIR